MRREAISTKGPARRACAAVLGDSRLSCMAQSVADGSALLPRAPALLAEHEQRRSIPSAVSREASRDRLSHQLGEGPSRIAGRGTDRSDSARRLSTRRAALADLVPRDGSTLLRHPSEARSGVQAHERVEIGPEHRAWAGVDPRGRARGEGESGGGQRRKAKGLVQKMEATPPRNGVVTPLDHSRKWTKGHSTTPKNGAGETNWDRPQSQSWSGFRLVLAARPRAKGHAPKTVLLSTCSQPYRRMLQAAGACLFAPQAEADRSQLSCSCEQPNGPKNGTGETDPKTGVLNDPRSGTVRPGAAISAVSSTQINPGFGPH